MRLFILLLAMVANVQAAELVFEKLFNGDIDGCGHTCPGWSAGLGDTGWNGSTRSQSEDSPNGCDEDVRFVLINDPENSLDQVAQLTQPGDRSCLMTDGKHRNILNLRGQPSELWWIEADVEYWIGYRMFFPDGYPSTYDGQTIHSGTRSRQGCDINTGRSVLRQEGGKVRRVQQVWSVRSGSGCTALHQNDQDLTLPEDQWIHFIERIYLTDSSDGYYEIWQDGVRVLNWQNIRTRSSESSFPNDSKISFGQYWNGSSSIRSGTYRVLIDDIRIATGADGYDLVDPEGCGDD